jgi:shikimate kinase
MKSFDHATATSHSAITVVSAFSSGKGVTVGIDIPCTVRVGMQKRNTGDPTITIFSKVEDRNQLIQTAVKRSLDFLRVKIPSDKSLRITVDSQIPAAVGLKSSSAVSVAVTKAIFDLFLQDSLKNNTQEILKLSCESSIRAGASLTGAFDDAAAGLLGGLVFSNNTRFKMLRHESLPENIGRVVKILVPKSQKKLTSSLNLDTYHSFRKQSLEAVKFASSGIFIQAMLLNSVIHAVIHQYSMHPVVSSIAEGASASGITGKGPAIAAICPNQKISKHVERRWIEENVDCAVFTASISKPVAGL